MSTLQLRAIAIALMFGFSMPVQSSDFKPARFGTGADSFLANLQCPELKDDDTGGIVYCRTRIRKNGKRDGAESSCFIPDLKPRHHIAYQRAANRALDKSVFVPAMVDGKNVEVLFEFRVLFNWDNDACQVAAIPNWGEEGSEVGINYFAPQQISPPRPGWWAGSFPQGGFLTITGLGLAVSVHVSEEGVPSDPRWENGDSPVIDLNPSDITSVHQLVRSVLRSLTNSRFIPGIHEGKPVAMRFFGVTVAHND